MPSSLAPARVYIDTNRLIADISPLLFGGFAEHMGRCIYGGIYDPDSPHADEQGFRRDVLDALRELDYSIIRYPGGNFLSGYHWRDGVGPVDQRPRRRELAWQSVETNRFGTNEFMAFCRKLNTLPMLGVNLGTGTIEEAGSLVEYCNAPTGTCWSDLRAAHGYAEPYGVQHWCLGNEMDGPWQIGHLEAHEYGYKAREAAKIMRWHDANLNLILCGSSNSRMPTYPEWDRTALEICYDHVDYHSMHFYANNRSNDTPAFLALTAEFETFVDTMAATLRYVKAKTRSKRDVYLSWDEWNIWYKNMTMHGGWVEAPHLIEEIYNLEDALLAAAWMNVFLRKSDVLKIACVAQIVNVIAPILTTPEQMLRQTIFYPFALFRRFARGVALDVAVKSPLYSTQQYGDVPVLDVSASYDPAEKRGAIFLVNRSLTDTLPVDVVWQDLAPARIESLYQMTGSDPKAANTFENPFNVIPMRLVEVPVASRQAALYLPPLSFTVAVCEEYR